MLKMKLSVLIILGLFMIFFLSWKGGEMMVLERQVKKLNDSLTVRKEYLELLEKKRAELIAPGFIELKARNMGMKLYEEKDFVSAN